MTSSTSSNASSAQQHPNIPEHPAAPPPVTRSHQPSVPGSSDVLYYFLAAVLGVVGLLHLTPGNGFLTMLGGICAIVASLGMFLKQPWAMYGIGGTMGAEIARFLIGVLMIVAMGINGDAPRDLEEIILLMLGGIVVSSLLGFVPAFIAFRWTGCLARIADDEQRCEHLVNTAGKGRRDKVCFWLSQGADVNRVHRRSNRTALVTAARNARADIVSLLLQAGADPRQEGKASILRFAQKMTPLQAAEKSGCRDCAEMIRRALTNEPTPGMATSSTAPAA